ncbi:MULTISPECIES: cell division protein PerM [Streptomyces]|uniref:Uncharacterized protein n=1 Tax=Streptomyces xinghaiensis TaxID=1038928 RepID=A0A3R7J1T8_9ACTN|nr:MULTISPECIES: DUF6350 family protein [Streptomyces]OFA37768.1 hypothetical protein BEN35_28565 [Streptomyces fradiae]RKM94083.1 hypothetical protein SFRA_020045 [Streptomyces xinghaiensis]RNC69290.1 hypothetical protein DC095_030045 [Streptomyces xinghaiensis]
MSRPIADPGLRPLAARDHSAAPPAPAGVRLHTAGAGVAGGAVAAGVGIGVPAVVVLAHWIVSADAGTGPEGALRTAAALWLLGHGVEVLRATGTDGGTAPVGLPPLLIGLLPVWLLFRSARRATEEAEAEAAESAALAEAAPAACVARVESANPRGAAAGGFAAGEGLPEDAGPPPAYGVFGTLGWLCAGYLLVGLAAALYADEGPLRTVPAEVLPRLVAASAAAVLCGTWASGGLAERRLPAGVRAALGRLPRALRTPFRYREAGAASRAAAVGVGVLLGGGALLTAVSLAVHGAEARDALLALDGTVPGRAAVLLLCLALAPNAAVWAAAYGLGPGFTAGAGSTVTALAATGYPELPRFPLLAALPAEGPGSPLTWAAGAIPVAAGLALGRRAALAAYRARAERRPVPTWWQTQWTALRGAVVCGLAMTLIAAVSGGTLGTGALARLGPDAWSTGVAAAAWTGALGLPTALVLHGWWLRKSRWRGAGPDVVTAAA